MRSFKVLREAPVGHVSQITPKTLSQSIFMEIHEMPRFIPESFLGTKSKDTWNLKVTANNFNRNCHMH
jgi:hypothetical protein